MDASSGTVRAEGQVPGGESFKKTYGFDYALWYVSCAYC
jgi:hypothetical protein